MSKRVPKRGDIVRCDYDFEEERIKYKINYPRKGSICVVAQVLYQTATNSRGLIFEPPYRLSIPLDDSRFEVVQDEWEGDQILNEAYKIANGL